MAYASLVQRAVAVIVDGIIVSIVGGILIMILGVVGVGAGTATDSEGVFAMIMGVGSLAIVLVMFLYYILLEGPMGGGQTLGKKLMGIKVTTEGGSVPSYVQVTIRTVLRLIDMMPTLYILGVILVAISEKKQRLGDMLAKTVVVTA